MHFLRKRYCFALLIGALLNLAWPGAASAALSDDLTESASPAELRALYEKATLRRDKLLSSLALGVAYLDQDSHLALQYLSMADLMAAGDGRLQPIVWLYVAKAKFKAGAYTAVVTTVNRLLAQPMGDGWEQEAYALLIESYAKIHAYPQLLNAYREYAKRHAPSKGQERLMQLAAVALQHAGDDTKAISIMEELATHYPVTEVSRWAFEQLVDRSCENRGEQAYHFSLALLIRLARNAGINTGLKEFLIAAKDQVMVLGPKEVRPLNDEEKLDYLARAHFLDEARSFALSLLHASPGPSSNDQDRAKLLLQLGRITAEEGDNAAASRYYAQYLDEYGTSSPEAPAVYERLAEALQRTGITRAASAIYAALARTSNDKTQRWQQFWSDYLGRDYRAALALLDRPGYVVSRERGLPSDLVYWRARVEEGLHQTAKAMDLYRQILSRDADSYYAAMVLSRHPEVANATVGINPATTMVNAHAEVQETTASSLAARILTPSPSPVMNPDLQLVADLLRVGMRRAARIQLESLDWRDYAQDDALAAVSHLAWQAYDYQPSRRIAFSRFSTLRSLPPDWSDLVAHMKRYHDDWTVYYPIAYEPIVTKVASHIGLDRFFLLSIMRAESQYRADARSPVGARGLMQLMPYTAVRVARELHQRRFEMENLIEPKLSIAYGGYYFRKLVRYYGNNPFLAAAAYNAGPQAVNRWLGYAKTLQLDEFIESIPFRETRNYVKEVSRNYAHYLRIYEGKASFKVSDALPDALPDLREIY